MAASRRLYQRIASELKAVRPGTLDDRDVQNAWTDAVEAVADALGEDNANFRRDLFLDAAGGVDFDVD